MSNWHIPQRQEEQKEQEEATVKCSVDIIMHVKMPNRAALPEDW
jgi:hypothetical protein